MIFACLQIFGILCSRLILVKRSSSQVSALGPIHLKPPQLMNIRRESLQISTVEKAQSSLHAVNFVKKITQSNSEIQF